MNSYLTKFEPAGRENCLCGSGKRFKNCCKNGYPDKHFDGWSLFNNGEYKKALTSIRHHISWYRLCHMAHTVPFLKSNTPESKELLKTDIEALSDLTGMLLSCYAKCNIGDEFLYALSNLSGAINDDRWGIKIDYHKCIYFYAYKNQKEPAEEILKAYDWREVNDVDLLTVLLDIYSESLNQVEMINIAEKICDISDSPAIKLQYGNLIGIEYCLLNDLKKGIPIIQNTIAEYEKIPNEKRTYMGRHHLALSYMHLGELTGDGGYLNTAVINLQNEISTKSYSQIGEAQLLFDIADCLYHLGDIEKSLKTYDKSINLHQSGLTLLFKARVLIKIEKISEAREMLHNVNLDELTPPNIFDYAISKCYLAISSKVPSDISEGLELITSIKTNDPMFKDVIQDLLQQLYELKNTGNGQKKAESALQKLNRYVSLKPNFFGFGIDINAIIDDVYNGN